MVQFILATLWVLAVGQQPLPTPSAGQPEPVPSADDDTDSGAPSEELPAIVEETLPTIQELAFPELTGDFDGDEIDDRAVARESAGGVQIALELSSTGATFVEALGADSLRQVEWQVIPAESLGEVCTDPVLCVSGAAGMTQRDVILVTLDDMDSFILRWDGDALETIFLDA